MSADNTHHIVNPNYSVIETKGPDNETIVEMIIESSIPLTLTQQDHDSTSYEAGVLRLPETTDLMLYGDEVHIEGELNAPGKNIMIFARRLIIHPTKGKEKQGAAIRVDGIPGAAPPIPLPKPATPTKTGSAGWTYTRPVSGGNSDSNGGTGVGGVPGIAGIPGLPGGPGGSIVLFAQEIIADQGPLLLSAKGGRGGDGQAGQPRGSGGVGGHGQDATTYWPPEWVYKPSSAGGRGGPSGPGGDGGPSGPGGLGGRIQVHIIDKQHGDGQVSPTARGGEAGDPGDGGVEGNPGDGGRGGNSATIYQGDSHGVHTAELPGSDDGHRGDSTHPGSTPEKLGPADDGSVEITYKSKYSELAKVAHLHQLQRVLGLTRALYLSADLKKNADRRKEVTSRLKWLRGLLTDFVALGIDGQPIADSTHTGTKNTQRHARVRRGADPQRFAPQRLFWQWSVLCTPGLTGVL